MLSADQLEPVRSREPRLGLDPRAVRRQFVPTLRPWGTEDLTRMLVFHVVAIGIVTAAWIVVSGTPHLDRQMLWLRIGVSGVLLSGLANGIWLMRGRHLVGLARRYVLAEFEASSEQLGQLASAPADDATTWEAVAGSRRFHRPGCVLVVGKAVVSGSREWHLQDGRTMCEACGS